MLMCEGLAYIRVGVYDILPGRHAWRQALVAGLDRLNVGSPVRVRNELFTRFDPAPESNTLTKVNFVPEVAPTEMRTWYVGL